MKPKKKKRAFTATDTLWKLVEKAAFDSGISINEWMTSAINQQLKEGINGQGLNVDEASELINAKALSEATSSAMQLEKAMERHRLFWASQMAKLEEKAKQKPNIK
mgnify:FL=1|tara:strand:- start:83 stop:400 length:318 start_codon:yes stop_codon:yes gene_type:complete